MSRRRVNYEHLYSYLYKRQYLTRADFKQLLKDAGVPHRVRKLKPRPVYFAFSLEAVRKVLSLHHQRVGATAIRKAQRQHSQSRAKKRDDHQSP